MNKFDLEERTMQFALKIVEFVATLPRDVVGNQIRFQLVKAGTSVGANYREANRAESRKDFIHKLAIVQKELSESEYWLKLCHASNLGNPVKRRWLVQEAAELLSIFTKSSKTAKART